MDVRENESKDKYIWFDTSGDAKKENDKETSDGKEKKRMRDEKVNGKRKICFYFVRVRAWLCSPALLSVCVYSKNTRSQNLLMKCDSLSLKKKNASL